MIIVDSWNSGLFAVQAVVVYLIRNFENPANAGLTVFFYAVKNNRMKVYQLFDGTLVGFYREAGFELEVLYYEDVYETRMVEKTEMVLKVSPPDMRLDRYWIEGHYETRTYTIPAHTEYQLVVIPGHYEKRTITTDAHWGTREYWLEEHIEIQYRYEGEPGKEAGRAGWVAYEVVIPGCWEERRIWFPKMTRTITVWVDIHEELQLVTIPAKTEDRREWVARRELTRWVDYGSKETYEERKWMEEEEVFVGRLPVYSAVDPSQATVFTVEEHSLAPVDVPYAEDIVTIRSVESGEVFTTTANYIGMATRIDDDEFVVP